LKSAENTPKALANFSFLTPKALANFSPFFTPKAFANVSPGLERSDYPGETSSEIPLNPERVIPAHA